MLQHFKTTGLVNLNLSKYIERISRGIITG